MNSCINVGIEGPLIWALRQTTGASFDPGPKRLVVRLARAQQDLGILSLTPSRALGRSVPLQWNSSGGCPEPK